MLHSEELQVVGTEFLEEFLKRYENAEKTSLLGLGNEKLYSPPWSLDVQKNYINNLLTLPGRITETVIVMFLNPYTRDFEILDGIQRMHALRNFVQGKFSSTMYNIFTKQEQTGTFKELHHALLPTQSITIKVHFLKLDNDNLEGSILELISLKKILNRIY
jgi:hypothetical protein